MYSSHLIATLRLRLEDTFVQKNKRKTGFPFGLYMPERIKQLPKEFFDTIETKTFQEIAYTVADAFFGEDVEAEALKKIVYDTLSFDCPVVKVKDNIYTLELFHGPTLAFKDVGARFMARLLQYFIRQDNHELVNVLVATSGDTGSAVANEQDSGKSVYHTRQEYHCY